ncbi:MAG: acyl-CoA dehydrogenase family protein [Sneathiellaceae bacterium]
MDRNDAPWMNEELRLLRDSAGKFFTREFAPRMERWIDQGMVDRDAWTTAGAAGLLCASIPEEYGGGGGTYAHEAVIVQEQVCAGVVGFGNSVHSGIVAHYLLSFGTEEQKRHWLPRMASGETVAAIAMSEPGAGSDLQNIKTTARKDGNHYVINGQKTFISNGQHADLVVTVCKTDPSLGAKGTSLILVDTNAVDGFRRGRNLAKLGQKAADTSELFFDDVRVPQTSLLGLEEGRGFGQLMNQLPWERLIIALRCATQMQHAVDLTLDYVRDRKAFGKAIFEFQNTRFKLAECQTVATVAKTFTDDCMVKLLAGELDGRTAAMAKWWVSDQQSKLIDECLQLHGGYGYMLEYPIARMYADSRVDRIYGGSNEIMKELVARGF